jgi:hypothetical protein
LISLYLKVDGKICGGTSVLSDYDIGFENTVLESGSYFPKEGVEDNIERLKTGEDLVNIFIDYDNNSLSGFQIGGMGADYLLELRGKSAKITSKGYFKYSGTSPFDWNWEEVGSIEAESDCFQLEAQISKDLLNINGPYKVYFQTSDWNGLNKDEAGEVITRSVDYPLSSKVIIRTNSQTRGVGLVVGEENLAPASIGWGDYTECEMLNFSIEGAGDIITLDLINITHGGSGEWGDCRVFIYNETGTSLGVLDGGEIILNSGGTELTGANTQIDITNVDVGPGYKAYFLISVAFTTTIDDVGDFHYVNITDEKDIWLTDAEDSISGNSFPLTGGPTDIIPEFNGVFLPAISLITIYMVHNRSRWYKMNGNRPVMPEEGKRRRENEL